MFSQERRCEQRHVSSFTTIPTVGESFSTDWNLGLRIGRILLIKLPSGDGVKPRWNSDNVSLLLLMLLREIITLYYTCVT